jgi:hypothetical protein
MDCECSRIPARLGAALRAPREWGSGYLHGPGGTGKSFRALQQLAWGGSRGAEARWISLPRYVAEERRAAMMRPEEAEDLLLAHATLRLAPFLVIDDLGAERYTELAAEALYLLLDERWATERPTIVTSNLTPAQLAEIHGDRIASRCLGLGTPTHLSGADRRAAENVPDDWELPLGWKSLGGWIWRVKPTASPEPEKPEPWYPITRKEIEKIHAELGVPGPAWVGTVAAGDVRVLTPEQIEQRRQDQKRKLAEAELGSAAEPD